MQEVVEVTWRGVLVTATVDTDPGVWTLPNGDPGYPPSTDIEDIKMFVGATQLPDDFVDAVLDAYNEAIMDKIIEGSGQ